jgi:hypothetical protein
MRDDCDDFITSFQHLGIGNSTHRCAAAAAFAAIIGTGLAIAAQNRRAHDDYCGGPVYYGGGPYYAGPYYYEAPYYFGDYYGSGAPYIHGHPNPGGNRRS